MVYKIEVEENGVWIDYTAMARLSFPITERLDTGYDSGQIVLESISRADSFLPYTRVRITADGKIFRFYVTSPQKPQVIYGATPKYTHTLPLVEPTKILETVFAETSTVTQKLKGIYTGNFTTTNMTYTGEFPDDIETVLFLISDPLFAGNNVLHIPTANKIVTLTSAYTFLSATITSDIGTLSFNSDVSIPTAGTYYIRVDVTYADYIPNPHYGSITYHLNVLNTYEQPANKTISSELQRIVNIAETCRNTLDTPRFVIDPLILAKYDEVDCPEFSMTRQTLWEKMLEVGNYIHAIPRLISDGSENWNVVTFDFLGKQDLAVNNGILSYKESSFNIDNYATKLDSQIDNIVNVDNLDEGSLVDPANNIFKTVRTDENSTEITDDNGFFATDKEIARLIKVEVKYDNVVYDITKYCYESFEYNCLSSYQSIYPYSKAYALEYVLGSKNITQLQHKNEDVISPVFKDWAIVNILRAVGATVPPLTTGLVISLQYRIEYIPVIATRLTQTKINAGDFDTKATLVYNQASNSVNSASYGENIKGAVLMYGNEDIAENYYTNSITKVPLIGTVSDGRYISAINYEFYKDFIKFSIEYSKDFNRLSGYVGVKSNVRMYEISERQVQDRNIMYNSEITVGTLDTTKQLNDTIIKYYGRVAIANTFNQHTGHYGDSTMAILQTFDKDQNLLKTVGLPLNTFGFGNSLAFTCKYADNYSAGNKAIRGQVANKLIQDYVPYTDPYGEIKYLTFAFTNPYATQSDYQAIADKLPEIDTDTFVTDFNVIDSGLKTYNPLTPLAGSLEIYKDSREAITLTVQIDFLTNDKNIILGYGLTHSNSLVCNGFLGKPVKVYAMPRKIGQFEQKVDLTGATLIKTFSSDVSGDWQFGSISDSTLPYMSIKPIRTTVNCQSLAFVDDNGDLVLGYNYSLNALQYSSDIFFNCK